jgi:hypothetical protein
MENQAKYGRDAPTDNLRVPFGQCCLRWNGPPLQFDRRKRNYSQIQPLAGRSRPATWQDAFWRVTHWRVFDYSWWKRLLGSRLCLCVRHWRKCIGERHRNRRRSESSGRRQRDPHRRQGNRAELRVRQQRPRFRRMLGQPRSKVQIAVLSNLLCVHNFIAIVIPTDPTKTSLRAANRSTRLGVECALDRWNHAVGTGLTGRVMAARAIVSGPRARTIARRHDGIAHTPSLAEKLLHLLLLASNVRMTMV